MLKSRAGGLRGIGEPDLKLLIFSQSVYKLVERLEPVANTWFFDTIIWVWRMDLW